MDALTQIPRAGRGGLTSNALKIIACVTMLLDHVGAYLFPDIFVLRVIGRVAFPVFAFFIAEGCRYTRNKAKRFFIMFGLGMLFETVYIAYNAWSLMGRSIWGYFSEAPWDTLEFILETCAEGNIFLTLSCSILIIYALQAFKQALAKRKLLGGMLSVAAMAGALLFGYGVNHLFGVQYGLFGIGLPAFAALTHYEEGKAPDFLERWDSQPVRLALFAVGIFLLWWMRGRTVVQFFGFLALIPLAFYNGKPGSKKFKWWFYVFYPAHLVIIWLIGMLL